MTNPASAIQLDGMTVTDSDLAALCGFSTRYIRDIAAGAKVGRNSYALGPALASLFEAAAGGGDLGKKLMRERIRKVAADADTAEMNYALARKEIAPLSEMKKAMDWRNGIVRQNVMQIPGRALTQLLGCNDEARFRQVLVDECKAALRQAAEAEMQPEDFDETDDNETEEDE